MISPRARRRLLTGLALTAGALLALWLALDLVLAAVVRREGRRVLGAPVTLSLALVRPLAGQAQLRSLTVAQPLGFGEGAALSLERLTVRMAPRAAWRDPLVIDEVLVQGAFVRVELRDKRTNLQALHAHALAALATPRGRSRSASSSGACACWGRAPARRRPSPAGRA